MRIISLTSIPPRFDKIGPTLDSLLSQIDPADRVILYIPEKYRRFPDWDGALPVVPNGIEIHQVSENFGPASKVLHAVREFAGTETELLFCDDDRYYYPRWSQIFWQARHHRPDDVIAPLGWDAATWFASDQRDRPLPRATARKRALDVVFQLEHAVWELGRVLGRKVEGPSFKFIAKPGYRDIFQGYGGVLVRPEFFGDDVFDIPSVYWAVDDIWLSGMLAKGGRYVWSPANVRGPRLTDAHDADPLFKATLDGATRHEADHACYEYLRKTFGVWP